MTTLTNKTKTNSKERSKIPSFMPGTICLSTINCTINGWAIEKGVIMIESTIDHQNKFLKGLATLKTLNSKL